MKLIREIVIVFGLYYIGEIISKSLSLPIPGNLIGMLLLFMLLCSKTVKLQQVERIGDFLLDHLAFFFIPAGVGLLTSFSLIADIWIQIVLVCAITTFFTMGIVGYLVQRVMNMEGE